MHLVRFSCEGVSLSSQKCWKCYCFDCIHCSRYHLCSVSRVNLSWSSLIRSWRWGEIRLNYRKVEIMKLRRKLTIVDQRGRSLLAEKNIFDCRILDRCLANTYFRIFSICGNIVPSASSNIALQLPALQSRHVQCSGCPCRGWTRWQLFSVALSAVVLGMLDWHDDVIINHLSAHVHSFINTNVIGKTNGFW